MKTKFGFLVFLIIITVLFSACNTVNPVTMHEQSYIGQQYDYDKIHDGDLSDFAGIWENGLGQRAQLSSNGAFALQKPDGTFLEGIRAGGFRYGIGMSTGGDDYM